MYNRGIIDLLMMQIPLYSDLIILVLNVIMVQVRGTRIEFSPCNERYATGL